MCYEFQPQETFRYSFEYVPTVPDPVDRIRYSVYTTFIDVNAPPTDEEIITSNVATAEVRPDQIDGAAAPQDAEASC